MEGLSSVIEGGYAPRNEARITEALCAAYRETFNTPSGRVALVDLALYSGFDEVSDLSVGLAGLAEANGMRKVFKRILAHLNLSPEERMKLAVAVRQENAITAKEI